MHLQSLKLLRHTVYEKMHFYGLPFYNKPHNCDIANPFCIKILYNFHIYSDICDKPLITPGRRQSKTLLKIDERNNRLKQCF